MKKIIKTMTIKNKVGRIVEVEHSRWVKLIAKEWAELILQNNEAKEPQAEKVVIKADKKYPITNNKKK